MRGGGRGLADADDSWKSCKAGVRSRACEGPSTPVCQEVCFFFQAEDGIRDVAVTGVQTCALPISRLYRPDFWKDGRILLVLERPMFPKFFAVFFGILAVAWILVVAKSADPKQLTLNEIGRASCRERV